MGVKDSRGGEMFKKFMGIFCSNYQAKLIALAIALVIWYYANSRPKEEITINVPLHIDVPDGYELVYQSHPRVQMRIIGSHSLIQRRQEESRQNYLSMSVRLDREDFSDGLVELEVDAGWLNVPESEFVQLDVGNLNPTTVRVYVSEIVERTMPVSVTVYGEPRTGYDVGSYYAMPDSVSVRGPAIALDQMSEISTEEISIWDARDNLRRMVPLQTKESIDIAGEGAVWVTLNPDPPRVAVNVEIVSERKERTYDDIPVQLLMPPDFPYEASIAEGESSVSVVIEGIPQQVESIRAEDFHVYVVLGGLSGEEIAPGASHPYKQRVYVRLQQDSPVRIIKQYPDQVTVVLRNPER
jgi:YbbR domain-containing protein